MLETYVCPACERDIEVDDEDTREYIVCSYCGDKLRSPNAPTYPPGTKIGDYVVKERIGVGGMGEVYLAEQKSMLRPVALKVLQPDLVEDKSYLERFYREVRMLAQIEHPNVVKAVEAGYDGDIYFFSMMYIEGKDLKKKMDSEGPMLEIDALYVALDVAEALKYVWNKHKIIHRDIKPANIIVTPEREVKLMDLGISKTMVDDRPLDLTLAGMMVGSPYYVSPEQARADKDIDWRADMYSLGATIFHLVTGNFPYDRENSMQIIAAHISEPIPNPKKANPKISDLTAAIVMRMMAKNREERYPSWDEAIEALRNAIDALATSTGAATSIVSVAGSDAAITGVPKRAAKGDVVDEIRKIPAKKLLADLRIRFVLLVSILFLTFVAFFKVATNSVAEAKKKRAEAHYAKAMRILQAKSKSKRELEAAYSALLAAKRAGNPKYAALAKEKLDELKRIADNVKRKRERETARMALNELKARSEKLEEAGKFDEAIRLWRDYQARGAYASDMKDLISERIAYLEKEKGKLIKRKEGVE